jgi:hypothetical protein
VSDLYRVPKHRLSVCVRTRDGVEESVCVFLSECADHHTGSERPVDLFNGSQEFLVVETSDREVAFLQRGSLSLVIIELDDVLSEELAGAELVAGDLDTEEAIRVVLDDGLELEGVARYQRPDATARLNEHLNAAEPFLPLYQGDRVCLINKARVARITLL